MDIIKKIELMTAITGNRNYIDAGQELAGDGKEDTVSMSDMFTRAEARGIEIGEARGEARGITIGEARGAAEREALRREIAELRRQLAKSEGKD